MRTCILMLTTNKKFKFSQFNCLKLRWVCQTSYIVFILNLLKIYLSDICYYFVRTFVNLIVVFVSVGIRLFFLSFLFFIYIFKRYSLLVKFDSPLRVKLVWFINVSIVKLVKKCTFFENFSRT